MRNGFKKALLYAAPAFLVGSLTAGMGVYAATRNVQALLGTSSISANGQVTANPPSLAYSGTTFVQLYSIQHSLINAGIPASWNGHTFSMQVPETGTSQPHLNALVFSTTQNPFEGSTGTLSSLTNSLPVGTDSFSTWDYIENVPQGSHNVKLVIYNHNGQQTGSNTSTYNAGTSPNEMNTVVSWKNIGISSGYNLVKVYLDGKYLGYSEVWGGN